MNYCALAPLTRFCFQARSILFGRLLRPLSPHSLNIWVYAAPSLFGSFVSPRISYGLGSSAEMVSPLFTTFTQPVCFQLLSFSYNVRISRHRRTLTLSFSAIAICSCEPGAPHRPTQREPPPHPKTISEELRHDLFRHAAELSVRREVCATLPNTGRNCSWAQL